MLVEILFWAFGTILVASAIGVISLSNPVHSAMLLVLCFFTSAAIWLLIEAEFLAVVLILVYVGAVMVLFLFVVMMLDINIEEMRNRFTRYWWLGLVVTAAVVAELGLVILARELGMDVMQGATPKPADYSNTAELGKVLYTDYIYAFELAAVLLLIAIIAAISLTMRKRPGLKQQDVAAQVAVRAQDRVRVVKVASEKTGAEKLP